MKWNINDDRPIWIQLKEQLVKQIVSGKYHCGDKLPSVRELAADAGVNPNTMQRALAALDQEGLIITNRTSGRCVTDAEEKIESCRKEIAQKIIRRYLEEMSELGYSRSESSALIEEGEEESWN